MAAFQAYIRALRGPIIIMGGSGFIGANLFKSLVLYRSDVYAVVSSEKGWRLHDVPDEFIIAVDINDSSGIKNLVEAVGPQTVFDCISYGGYSFEEDSALIYKTNFQSTVNLISLLAEKPFTSYIHAGSSSEYGTNSAAPLENASCLPNSPYAVSKLAIANYLYFMGKHRKFPCINLRLYSVYGPLEDTSRLIPNLVRQATIGKLPPFVNGLTSRDFVYVEDVCAAFIMAAAKIQPDIYGESFNIGTGIKTSMRELAEITRVEFSVKGEAQFGKMEDRIWDLHDWYANSEKAKNILGWNPKFTLSAGLKLTAKWVGKLSDEEFTSGTKKDKPHKKASLTAIIACYKDEDAIPLMYRRLTNLFRKIGIDYEIIFVNDCSPDNSEKIIQQLSATDNHVIGISHSRNFGSQMAFRSGMELATKQGVVLLDGDLQDPPELIENFFEKWEQGYDVVYGRRIKRDMPWHWEVLYKLFYRLFAAFSYIKIPLNAGDFSLIDRRVVGWMLKCPERDLFMRGLRAYVGFKQVGVDYVRPDRMFGKSTNSFMKNIDWAKKGIFSFSDTPLNILTVMGFFLLVISFLLVLCVAGLKIFYPEIAPQGITTLLIAVLAFGSLNLFAIGLVGEYVAKIMSEVKGRPRLIRSTLIRNGKASELLPDAKHIL